MPPSTQLERRLLWHPRHDNKFVVGGGTQITLYEWSQTDSIRHVTSQLDLQFMRCFDWSPDPAFDDLFAIGNSTGRVDILRLQPYKPATQNNVLSTGPIVPLPARNSRACNSLSFCNVNPNYLAVGLEKVRGDCSLVIWDIQTAKATLSLSSLLPTTASAYADFTPLPRLDIGPRADPRILQQHAPTEVVSCLSFLPDTTDSLLAGISHRWLRLVDLRSPHTPAINVAAKVEGITIDPFDNHRVACYGDGVVTVWDARSISHPLLTFTEKDAAADGGNPRSNSTYTNLEFSNSRRGTLASMEKDGRFVRLWNTMDITTNVSAGESISRESSMSRHLLQTQPKRSWANLSWSATTPSARPVGSTMEREQARETVSTTVLHNTHRTKAFPKPLASFALVPSSQAHPLTSNIMVVTKDGDLELYAVNDVPKSPAWGRRGDLSVSAGQSSRIFFGLKEDDKSVPEPWEVQGNPIISASVSRSASNAGREDHGKSRAMSPPAMFGRGDEDGFPTLLSTAIRRKSSDEARSGSRQRQSGSQSLQVQQHFAKPDKSFRTPAHSPSRKGEDDRGRPRRKHTGSRAARAELKGITGVIQDDVSMVMWRRTIRGYSLSDYNHNANIMREKKTSTHDMSATLGDVWSWLSHSRECLSIPNSNPNSMPNAKINEYDFAYEGLRGIWEGVPLSKTAPVSERSRKPEQDLLQPSENTHSRSSKRNLSPTSPKDIRDPFTAALQTLSTRKGLNNVSWKPAVTTSKPLQRQVALQLCGWSMKEEDLNNDIRRWEKEKQLSRAACWLTFTKQQGRASMLLLQSDDELHHMMSGTLAALSAQNSRNSDLREHCERLIVKIQDPYFRAMLTYLTLGDWTDVLDEEMLPFHERLAIAFQFLDDKLLTSYLRRCAEKASAHGDIDAILVTGLTRAGMDILQGYVDRTGDVQTAAILSSLVCPWKFTDSRHEQWLESYRDLLDGFKLHHFRVAFDVDRGQILQGAIQDGDYEAKALVPSQILIRCNYCNKTVNPAEAPSQVSKPTVCPHCNRSLPRCAICLLSLGIIYDSMRNAELAHANEYRDTIDDAIVICQSCRHGGHSSHILDWFFTEEGESVHEVCPVADCDCRCADAF